MKIISCGSASKSIYQAEVMGTQVRYYVTENPNYGKGEGRFYSRVDSGNVRIFYSFRSDNIFKTYNNARNYVNTLVFDNQPVLQLTSLDNVVLRKADILMDSLGYKDLKRSKGATGFVVEVARH